MYGRSARIMKTTMVHDRKITEHMSISLDKGINC
jgi:hypothetical protein